MQRNSSLTRLSRVHLITLRLVAAAGGKALLTPALCAFASLLCAQPSHSSFRPVIRRVWDDAALADWATPLAGLNRRPTHISAAEYYSMPIDNLKTYPVYIPGREPEGYWEM